MNQHLLRLDLSVAQYREIFLSDKFSVSSDLYLNRLPLYTTARCPICGWECKERIDTYSLTAWSDITGKAIFKKAGANPCKHLFLATHFIHLHGMFPQAKADLCLHDSLPLLPEIPHVIPAYLGSDPACQAVLHSLPICRIEEEQFVPRYTLTMLSYFAPEPHHARLVDIATGYVRTQQLEHFYRFDLWPFSNMPPEELAKWWNLEPWVEAGKLLWLDAEQPGLPLRNGPVQAFPYRNLEGRRFPYLINLPVKQNVEKAIRRLLPDPDWDDQAIAESCSVPVKIVREIRQRVGNEQATVGL